MADQKIHLNLDTIAERKYEPYTFSIGEKTFTFTDPTELDWQVVQDIASLDDLVDLCMSEEDGKAFRETPLAAYKVGLLFEDVQKHFDLGEYASRPRRR